MLTVETEYLNGYADQIDGNRTNSLAAAQGYCERFCGDTAGLDGLLAVARFAVDNNTEMFVRLMEGAERGLELTADKLRRTADDYDRSEDETAEQLWTLGPTGDVPDGYQERDVEGHGRRFTDGASVHLAVPEERQHAEDAKASVISILGTVNRVVEWVTGRDLLGEALPIVFGEWGVLRRIAEAHDELERAYDLIAEDLEFGMDILSPHWTSEGEAGASTAFDHHIRRQWIPGFRALANASNAAQQTYEWIANAYEYIVNAFLLALNFYGRRIKGAIDTLATTLNPIKAAYNLFKLVTAVLQLIADTIRMIYLQTKMFISSLEMMVANLHFMYDYFRGDLGVFQEG